LVNISESRVFLETHENLPLGAELKFKLTLDGCDRSFEMAGVVIRHGTADRKSGFAVEYTRMNPAHRRSILDIIKKKSEEN